MMFASKTPRQAVSHPDDSEYERDLSDAEWREAGLPWVVQHNEPNPILVAFRDYVTEADLSSFVWSAALWLDHLDGCGDPSFDVWHTLDALRPIPAEVVDHARRVLTRLAGLAASA